MTTVGKFKAGLKISLVSGAFWAVGGAVFGLALLVSSKGLVSISRFPTVIIMLAMGLVAGITGMIGGALYALAIAAQSKGGEGTVLTTRRAALAGAMGGIALMVLERVVVDPFITVAIPPPTLIGVIFSAVLHAGLGAATGAAIFGTARRGKVPLTGEGPDQIAP